MIDKGVHHVFFFFFIFLFNHFIVRMHYAWFHLRLLLKRLVENGNVMVQVAATADLCCGRALYECINIRASMKPASALFYSFTCTFRKYSREMR